MIASRIFFLNPEMPPGISEAGACIEVAARSGTWGSECPLLYPIYPNYRRRPARPRSIPLPRCETPTQNFIVPSMVWWVTALFGCVYGLTGCHRGRSKATPRRSMGSSTLLTTIPRRSLTRLRVEFWLISMGRSRLWRRRPKINLGDLARTFCSCEVSGVRLVSQA